MSTVLRLVIASGNRHKIEELQAMVADSGLELRVEGVEAHGVPPEIEETEDTFLGNALLKARGIAQWLQGQGVEGEALVLADDSGISVHAFEGAPGVRSARYAGEHATDAQNNAKLVRELEAKGLESSTAHYTCVLALVRVDGQPVDGALFQSVEGRWDVEVRREARGDGGFGYDPHAWLDAGSRTVAELSPEDKAKRSHRGQATRRLLGWLAAWRKAGG